MVAVVCSFLTLWRSLWEIQWVLASPDPYWLARCEGWQVSTPKGHLGSVRRLLYGTRLEVPDALLIRAGLFRRRWLVVAIEAVSEAIPWQGTLKLTCQPSETDYPTVLSQQARRRRPTLGTETTAHESAIRFGVDHPPRQGLDS